MQHMGITKESVKDHTVYLIDCIGSGGGLAYLTRCIAEIAYNGELTEEATSHINIIALNEVDQKYIKFSCELKRHDLKMHALTKT